MGEQAIVFLPEFIFDESGEDSVFFNMQDELGFAGFELDNVRFHNGRDAVAITTNTPAIQFGPVINECQVTEQVAAVLCVQV